MRQPLIPRTNDVWDPFDLARDIREEMDRPFGRALLPGRLWGSGKALFAPDVDMRDEKDRIIVKADIPGINKEDLSITVKDDLLTLKGERKESHEKKDKDYFCSERFEGSFVRVIELPSGVKSADVKATYKDGVLEIVLPKDENSKPNEVRIQIQYEVESKKGESRG